MTAFNSADGLRIADVTQSGKVFVSQDQLSDVVTYTASFVGAVTATTPTDVFTLTGSATKIIRLVSLMISGSQTTANTVVHSLVKRSTPNTGGTSTILSNVSMDADDGAASAIVRAYTANPTLGTTVGSIFSFQKMISTLVNVATEPKVTTIVFKDLGMKEPVLRNENQSLCLNLNSTTVAGNTYAITAIWSEESA